MKSPKNLYKSSLCTPPSLWWILRIPSTSKRNVFYCDMTLSQRIHSLLAITFFTGLGSIYSSGRRAKARLKLDQLFEMYRKCSVDVHFITSPKIYLNAKGPRAPLNLDAKGPRGPTQSQYVCKGGPSLRL